MDMMGSEERGGGEGNTEKEGREEEGEQASACVWYPSPLCV
jgi:hypothetical protein